MVLCLRRRTHHIPLVEVQSHGPTYAQKQEGHESGVGSLTLDCVLTIRSFKKLEFISREYIYLFIMNYMVLFS